MFMLYGSSSSCVMAAGLVNTCHPYSAGKMDSSSVWSALKSPKVPVTCTSSLLLRSFMTKATLSGSEASFPTLSMVFSDVICTDTSARFVADINEPRCCGLSSIICFLSLSYLDILALTSSLGMNMALTDPSLATLNLRSSRSHLYNAGTGLNMAIASRPQMVKLLGKICDALIAPCGCCCCMGGAGKGGGDWTAAGGWCEGSSSVCCVAMAAAALEKGRKSAAECWSVLPCERGRATKGRGMRTRPRKKDMDAALRAKETAQFTHK
mmetsp:Transcript_34900/g.86640  ORF Transcript_34900/g.86640 Transcript_34900/m.86640 type:complete len:267 (+) Transcript_34900:684-1484(+)